MNDIWKHPDVRANEVCESRGDRIEEQFLDSLLDNLVGCLRIEYRSQEIVRALLKTALKNGVRELLKQYLNHELEIIGQEINNDFSIEEKVCYNYATHAKLRDHMKAIKNKTDAIAIVYKNLEAKKNIDTIQLLLDKPIKNCTDNELFLRTFVFDKKDKDLIEKNAIAFFERTKERLEVSQHKKESKK